MKRCVGGRRRNNNLVGGVDAGDFGLDKGEPPLVGILNWGFHDFKVNQVGSDALDLPG